MPTPQHGSGRRPTPPLRAVQRVLVGLALSCVGWAAVVSIADAAEGWRRPVPGPTVRPFALGRDPFAAGQHRGVDLAAPAGRPVVAACAGVVVFAGRVPRHGRAVSVRCGRWRVSYLPLGSASVRRGATVLKGEGLGTAGAGHRGALHVGVRREGRRGRYVDPEPLFASAAPLPIAGPGRRPGFRGPPPRPAPDPPALRPVGAPPAPALAPWHVWLGLALVLAGVTSGGTVVRRRRARATRLAGERTA